MFAKESDTFTSGIRHALSLPIRTRCAELTVLFDRGTTLELQNFFPLLVDHIFGPQGTVTWGLRTTLENETEDFMQLQHFLSPCGPFFKLIYALLKDPSAKYDFPISYLPIKMQQVLENAQVHPFYADLIHVNSQTKRLTSLLLNPFDYYIFHFAYYLINPWHQQCGTTYMCWNTVYYVLCCDYMLHFLPSNLNCNVLPQIYYNGKNPTQHFHYLQYDAGFKSPSKLINAAVLNKSFDEYRFNRNFNNPRCEIWRSETVLTVFVDMWLNCDQVTQQSNEINNAFNRPQIPRLVHYNELPTVEYMRIMRVLMKQLHAFSASAKIDDTPMHELKKIAIPMVQGKFYIFLRNLIHRWPLDGSFRLVLELWLTYIQPWRYPPDLNDKSQKCSTNYDAEDINAAPINSIDRDHMQFIAENLLTYVVIFQQLLPRFTRVDLISPKMALMLYRITKVFGQSNLASLLKEIECCVENNHSPTNTSYNVHLYPNLPPLNPTHNWSTNTSLISSTFDSSLDSTPKHILTNKLCDKKWSVVVRQKIFELEGQNFCYKRLFSVPPAPEVYDLIRQIKKSIVLAQELIAVKRSEECNLGFWGAIAALWQSSVTNDEFTLNDRLKVPPYLEASLQNMMELFQIKDIPEVIFDNTATNLQSPSKNASDSYKFLTPSAVRERAKKIKYEGDPDLYPIRSTEIAYLVRLFYKLTLKINEKYGQQFGQLYYSSNYWGRLSRQILSSPLTIYKYDKTKLGSPRVSTELPPRISLRPLASYKCINCIVFLIVLFFLFGFKLPTCLILVYVLYKCIKAIRSTPVRHNYPTQGFGNISFNDSF